jgi:hypothetical protein
LEELVLKSGFEVIVLHFVEAIHVELPYKAVHFFVPEVPGQHYLLELHDILDDKLESVGRPVDNFLVVLNLSNGIVTPSSSKVLKTKPATSFYSCCLLWDELRCYDESEFM